MILLIDNYDSFTHNLAHLIGGLGRTVDVVRNDAITVEAAIAAAPEAIILSPGPRTPDDAGVCLELVRAAEASRTPLFGVCLGLQAIAQALGGSVAPASQLMHGKVSAVRHRGEAFFAALPSPFNATRYHSLAANRNDLPASLEVAAESDGDGEIMALIHTTAPIGGVQFHPESIASEHGAALIDGFFSWSRARAEGAPRVAPIQKKAAQRDDERRLRPALRAVADGGRLDRKMMRAAVDAIFDGDATDIEIAGFLMGLRARGETADELAAAAEAMRDRAVPVDAPDDVVDTCGTGGDGAGTFNISTAAALIAAGAGARVAKHGNRAASSKSGSSDVLAALGVNLNCGPDRAARAIREAGVGFLFAARHHPALVRLAPIRKALGVRTLFNLLGPLTNPAGARRQLIGVFDRAYARPVAEALRSVGATRAWVVHGGDGLDELTTTTASFVAALDNSTITEFEITPEAVGLARATPADLVGGEIADNAAALRALLENEASPAHRDIAVLNAAAALVVAERADDLSAGVRQATASLETGAAATALARLVEITNAPERAP